MPNSAVKIGTLVSSSLSLSAIISMFFKDYSIYNLVEDISPDEGSAPLSNFLPSFLWAYSYYSSGMYSSSTGLA